MRSQCEGYGGSPQVRQAVCPNAKVFWSLTHGRPEVSAADTQMINIEEMARMAQEGIEVETTEVGYNRSESGGKEGQQEEMNAAEDGSGNQSPPF